MSEICPPDSSAGICLEDYPNNLALCCSGPGYGRGFLLELCPRGNNKDVIIIILVHDNVYIPC
jgi:hypothetical protein